MVAKGWEALNGAEREVLAAVAMTKDFELYSIMLAYGRCPESRCTLFEQVFVAFGGDTSNLQATCLARLAKASIDKSADKNNQTLVGRGIVLGAIVGSDRFLSACVGAYLKCQPGDERKAIFEHFLYYVYGPGEDVDTTTTLDALNRCKAVSLIRLGDAWFHMQPSEHAILAAALECKQDLVGVVNAYIDMPPSKLSARYEETLQRCTAVPEKVVEEEDIDATLARFDRKRIAMGNMASLAVVLLAAFNESVTSTRAKRLIRVEPFLPKMTEVEFVVVPFDVRKPGPDFELGKYKAVACISTRGPQTIACIKVPHGVLKK